MVSGLRCRVGARWVPVRSPSVAVAEGESWMWAGRLRLASEVLHREARWLGSDVSGPFSMVVRMAASDVWGGPFADQLQGTIRSFDRQLVPWGEHLGRFERALEEAAQEAEVAAQAQASGVAAPIDVEGVLARWRVWPPASWPLDPGWAAPGGRPATFVWVYPERARQLAVGLRQVAEQLRACRNRLGNGLAPLPAWSRGRAAPRRWPRRWTAGWRPWRRQTAGWRARSGSWGPVWGSRGRWPRPRTQTLRTRSVRPSRAPPHRLVPARGASPPSNRGGSGVGGDGQLSPRGGRFGHGWAGAAHGVHPHLQQPPGG